VRGDPLVYISNRAKMFIERYYTTCGLETQFLQMIFHPPELGARQGCGILAEGAGGSGVMDTQI